MLDSGDFVTIAELAAREGIAVSYLTRILRLILLAPETVEAILDGTRGGRDAGAAAGGVPGGVERANGLAGPLGLRG
jgi:ParB-like chromosome segregation protein Spo0J